MGTTVGGGAVTDGAAARGRRTALSPHALALRVPTWLYLELMLPFAVYVSIEKHVSGYVNPLPDVARSTGQAVAFVLGGLFLRHRLRSSRLWLPVVVTGFALLAEDLQSASVAPLWGIGLMTANLSFPAMLWLALSYPTGVMQGRLDRWLVAVGALGAVGMAPWDTGVPRGAQVVRLASGDGARAISGAGSAVMGIVLALTLVRLVHRWARSDRPKQRMFLPFAAGWITLLVVPQFVYSFQHARDKLVHPVLRDSTFTPYGHVLLVLIPVLSLVAGALLLRTPRIDVDERVDALGDRVTPGALRDVLSEVLGDPDVEVLVHDQGRFTDAAGAEVGEPVPPRGRAVMILGPQDAPVGAVVHAAGLLHDPQLHASVRRAAGQALEVRRLRATAADARRAVYAATDAARRQLERDLHDGAQQRLIGLAFSLTELRAKLDPAGDPAVAEVVTRVTDELRAAITDLRRLAAGTFPAALADSGLGTALEELVERTPLRTTLTGEPGPGLDELTQATAYFVVCEGIANALKHADARRLELTISRTPGELGLQLSDDGRGGARADGPGLRGLAERVTSTGGTLRLDSPRHGGTTLEVRLPLVALGAPGGAQPGTADSVRLSA